MGIKKRGDDILGFFGGGQKRDADPGKKIKQAIADAHEPERDVKGGFGSSFFVDGAIDAIVQKRGSDEDLDADFEEKEGAVSRFIDSNRAGGVVKIKKKPN